MLALHRLAAWIEWIPYIALIMWKHRRQPASRRMTKTGNAGALKYKRFSSGP